MRKPFAAFLLLWACLARAEDGGLPFTLFDDYRCPPAPPMSKVDGGWLATETRKQRIDCGLAGANAELHEWRPKAEAAPAKDPGFQLQASHGVLSILSAILTAELAVITNRASRGCRAVANPFASCN